MRLRKTLGLVIPGVAHIERGRTRRGLTYFFLFAFFANGALIAPLLTSGPAVRWACILAAAGLWIWAAYDAARTAGGDGASDA